MWTFLTKLAHLTGLRTEGAAVPTWSWCAASPSIVTVLVVVVVGIVVVV
jgi:hypothetical protein